MSTYISNPTLDASTLSERVDDIESLNEKSLSDKYEIVGDGSRGQSYSRYFYIGDMSRVSLQYLLTIPAASFCSFGMTIAVSYETGDDPSTLDYNDQTLQLSHAAEGEPSEMVDAIYYSLDINGDGSFGGLISDPDHVLSGANFIRLDIGMEDNEDLTIYKTGRAI